MTERDWDDLPLSLPEHRTSDQSNARLDRIEKQLDAILVTLAALKRIGDRDDARLLAIERALCESCPAYRDAIVGG